MAHTRRRRAPALAFDALNIEGALISPAILARIATHKADGQTEADYGLPKGLTLRDEIARYFRIGQALFAGLAAAENPSASATINFVEDFLRDVLCFNDVERIGLKTQGDRRFVVTLEGLSGRVPIVVVPPADDLDRPSDHLPTDGRKRSAASAIQDWLSANKANLWGFCCNGFRMRLVRDNASLTRPAYIEADLRAIFEEEIFADFTVLWLLVHVSRFGRPGTPPSDCALERWREAGQKEGVAARDRLRDGVEAALLSFGNGFLGHPDNGALREKLRSGELPLSDFFGQLLRLVYRLIFLLAAEDRDLLHPPGTNVAARKLYAEGYSVAALRESAVRRGAWDRHHDRWDGLLITFAALGRGEKLLGLPALDGLFAPGSLGELENTRLTNRGLMEAIYRLVWIKDDSGLVPVNWRDMQTEELGSVYESLLELTPQINGNGRQFKFAEGGEAKGHTRKTTGSYYTPDSLVQTLLDSALDPVLNRIEAETDDRAAGLLAVTVLDPACGSGHFLLAAARRLATRLAQARTNDIASPADYRHALRDVTRACMYGVDRNPMAVELTKVALWIETVEPGKPLGFLDANIRCGDSLFGVFDLKVLAEGIPDAAYRPLTGDDKEAAKIAGRINREQREAAAQQDLALAQGASNLARAAQALGAMPEDDLAGVQARARAYAAVHSDRSWWATKTACDLYIAAFLVPKHFRAGALARARAPDCVPTTLDVRTALMDREPDSRLVLNVVDWVRAARVFHWPLEFPAVIAGGGFDIVLGNPPWERIKLQEQEFFAAREPEIADAPNAAARAQLISKLKEATPGSRERGLYDEFESAKRSAEASSVFARLPAENGGRFALTGRGDVNTYALFAELFANLCSKRGRAGVIVPTGIATEATTAPFFAVLTTNNRLIRLLDFENREALFPAIDSRMKFSLLTIGHHAKRGEFAFFLTDVQQLAEPERVFTLSADEIKRVNPNTRTVPVFRSKADAELATKIYSNIPVLIQQSRGLAGNQWGISVSTRLWHMAEDSAWFLTSPTEDSVPLYEAKMIHQFDHRFSSFGGEVTSDLKKNPKYEPQPRYWVKGAEVDSRLLQAQNWKRGWLTGWRDITNATNERTVIFSFIPRTAVGHTCPLLFTQAEPQQVTALIANLNSLVLDFIARQKVGGTHLAYNFLQQFPVLPPSAYVASDFLLISQRVLELTYTSYSMLPFARDLGYDGPPFVWNEDRRVQLRAELDAFYARAYGLTRDELRYILDPADVKGPDYPSETFRVLKKNEIAKYGEYRTARLVLQAWDRLENGEIAA
jgi:hypothetical protein